MTPAPSIDGMHRATLLSRKSTPLLLLGVVGISVAIFLGLTSYPALLAIMGIIAALESFDTA